MKIAENIQLDKQPAKSKRFFNRSILLDKVGKEIGSVEIEFSSLKRIVSLKLTQDKTIAFVLSTCFCASFFTFITELDLLFLYVT